jgi:hypothetical protein
MEAFYQNTYALIEAIEECLEKRRLMPCLVLLYTGIDVFSSLERHRGEATKRAFTAWADSYLLKARPLPCTALELYAARCGVLHTFASDSDLFQKGQVRQIFYAWGTADENELQECAAILQRTDCVAVHLRDLIDAFRDGLAAYLDELSQDEARQQVASKQAGMWLMNADPQLVQRLIELHRGRSPGGQA